MCVRSDNDERDTTDLFFPSECKLVSLRHGASFFVNERTGSVHALYMNDEVFNNINPRCIVIFFVISMFFCVSESNIVITKYGWAP